MKEVQIEGKSYAIRVPENFDEFRSISCNLCTANEWYCPSDCDTLCKAKNIPFEKIQKSIKRNEEDYSKVFRYIKRYKGGI